MLRLRTRTHIFRILKEMKLSINIQQKTLHRKKFQISLIQN